MKIRGGYILQPRCISKSDVSKMPPVTRELWNHLLRNVNHKDKGKFKRGSGFFNLGDIQEALCWYVGYRKMVYSKPQLTKSLRRLCGDNMIATAKATRGLFITICKYDFYQDPGNYEGNGEGHAKETRRKREGHTKNKNVKNDKNEIKKRLKTFLSDSTEYRLAELLFNKICERNPNHKKPNLQTWAKHIDYALRIDKRNKEDLEKIIVWCQKDEFWQNNILSTAKLREKFDQLILKKNSNGGSDTLSKAGRKTAAAAQKWLEEEGWK